MAIGDAYATPTAYRAAIEKTDTADDTQIATDLLAVSRLIDRETDRRATGFNKDASAVARIFYPRGYYAGDPEAENPWRGVRGQRVLDIDELAAVPTAVKIDTGGTGNFTGATVTTLTNPDSVTGLLGGDYQCWPLNQEKGPEPAPWTALIVPTWSTKLNGWQPGYMVQITAQWGWPAVPAGVVDACIQVTAILRLDSNRATQRIPEGVTQAFAQSPRAQSIVAELAKAYHRERIYA